MNSLFQFKRVSVSIEGDSYQVVFDDGSGTDDEPYFMIQRQFEFPDGGICHFESHKEILIEQCRVKLASLLENKLQLSYGKSPRRDVEIQFILNDVDFKSLASTLKEMIPETIIVE